MSWMLKNSSGVKDGMFTLSVVSFVVVSVCVVISMFDQITLGSSVFHIKSPDVALLTLYLSISHGSYVWRRGQKLKDGKVQEVNEEVEKKNEG